MLTEEILREKYPQLDYLLLMFSCACYEGTVDESHILWEYLNHNLGLSKEETLYKASLALAQAEEVLGMEPFPEELLKDLTNSFDNSKTRKKWLEKIIIQLNHYISEMNINEH